jgi:hypothetical protein
LLPESSLFAFAYHRPGRSGQAVIAIACNTWVCVPLNLESNKEVNEYRDIDKGGDDALKGTDTSTYKKTGH